MEHTSPRAPNLVSKLCCLGRHFTLRVVPSGCEATAVLDDKGLPLEVGSACEFGGRGTVELALDFCTICVTRVLALLPHLNCGGSSPPSAVITLLDLSLGGENEEGGLEEFDRSGWCAEGWLRLQAPGGEADMDDAGF